jgi:hypothetical protein
LVVSTKIPTFSELHLLSRNQRAITWQQRTSLGNRECLLKPKYAGIFNSSSRLLARKSLHRVQGEPDLNLLVVMQDKKLKSKLVITISLGLYRRRRSTSLLLSWSPFILMELDLTQTSSPCSRRMSSTKTPGYSSMISLTFKRLRSSFRKQCSFLF